MDEILQLAEMITAIAKDMQKGEYKDGDNQGYKDITDIAYRIINECEKPPF